MAATTAHMLGTCRRTIGNRFLMYSLATLKADSVKSLLMDIRHATHVTCSRLGPSLSLSLCTTKDRRWVLSLTHIHSRSRSLALSLSCSLALSLSRSLALALALFVSTIRGSQRGLGS